MSVMVRTGLSDLSAAEKLALIEELWDSLSDADVPVPQEHLDEINRRLADFETELAKAKTWTDLRQDLLQKFS